MRSAAPLRITRALAITALITALAAAAHTGAGGVLPDLPILAALCLIVLLPVSLCTTRRLGLPTLSALMVAGQLILHEAFAAFAPAVSCAPAHPAAWGHHTPFAWAGCPAPAAVPDTAAMLLMPAIHLAAAAVMTLLMAKSESALWAAAAWLRPLTRVPVLPAFPVRPVLKIHAPEQVRATHRAPKAHPLRGPPAQRTPATRQA
ncbi:hypothetical protein ACFVWT_19035 [Arthrobacter sp. NPDC058288]|uniref:hypothetical protein n=1 Tax=Arthrobacter sp. NPDC058288 TaxID=3346424 RepID=UPI0036E1C502